MAKWLKVWDLVTNLMKNSKLNNRCKTSGEGIVIVIILLALIGGGVWWLYAHKRAMDKEARAWGRQMIQRLVVNHDLAFFSNNLSPQAKLDYPPSDQELFINQLKQLGVPAQPIKIEEKVTWESHFFEPSAFFTAHLNYPAGPATLEMAINHPVGKWQLLNVTFTPPKGL
jgi:hypothetical protein